jgi:hypothetical protein
MPALPDFRLEAYFSRWEFTARYNLTASDAQTMSLAELLELADDDGRARWESLHLGYTETRGLPALREAIAATYDNVAAQDVLCFTGAEEAIYRRLRLLPPLPRPGRRRGDVHRPRGAAGRAAASGQHLPVSPDSHAGRPVPRRGRAPRLAGSSRLLGRLAGQAPVTALDSPPLAWKRRWPAELAVSPAGLGGAA